MKKNCVGIDVAKKIFVAAIKVNDKHLVKTFDNKQKGFDDCLTWITAFYSNANLHVCMEATGRYGEEMALYYYEKNIKVSVVNPVLIKKFRDSYMIRNKTDSIDAQCIYDYCHERDPGEWQPVSKEVSELQALVKRLDVLNNTLLQEKNRLEFIDEVTKTSIEEHISYLKKDIKVIEKAIKSHIEKHEKFDSSSILLNSIPGIGDKTTAKVLAFLDIELFSHPKKMVAFIGLSPKHQQSGTSVNTSSLSRMGDSKLRKIFYMPALVAIQREPRIKQFYENLRKRGKPSKVAIVAVMRKLVHIIYGVLKTGKPFDVELAFQG